MSKEINEKGYLSSTQVVDIFKPLGVDFNFIRQIKDRRVVNIREDSVATSYWGADDLFKMYCFILELEKYSQKFGNKKIEPETDFSPVIAASRATIVSGRYKETLSSEGWRKIVEKATEAGVDFKNSRFKYVRPKRNK